MCTISEMVNRLSNLNVDAEAKQATAKHGKDYILLNQEQMKYGLRSDGTRIGKYKSKNYAKFKNEQNSLPGMYNVDLILTGAFISSMEFDLESDVMNVIANDPNDLLSESKYGPDVFGLTDKSKIEMIDIVRPTFLDQIKARL